MRRQGAPAILHVTHFTGWTELKPPRPRPSGGSHVLITVCNAGPETRQVAKIDRVRISILGQGGRSRAHRRTAAAFACSSVLNVPARGRPGRGLVACAKSLAVAELTL